MSEKKDNGESGKEIDYKQLYDDLKTTADSMETTLKKDIENLKSTITDKDAKISELQTYICKNLTSDKSSVQGADKPSFEDRYKNALKQMDKK